MKTLQIEITEDLENAFKNQGKEFLKLTNKEMMDDLRDCTTRYLDVPDLTMLLIIKQWQRRKGESIEMAYWYDKNAKRIRAGDTLRNPFNYPADLEVLGDGSGQLFLGDMETPFDTCYQFSKYWEIVDLKQPNI